VSQTSSSPARLKRRAGFLRVAATGRKTATHGLVLQALKRDDAEPARIGFTVTKKIGGAVVRNRTRRRLKEAARLELAEHPVSGVDLVVIGREATRGRDFTDLRDDLRRALRKTGVTSQASAPPAPASPVSASPVSASLARASSVTASPMSASLARTAPVTAS
jgi:ribonuclease P protein component